MNSILDNPLAVVILESDDTAARLKKLLQEGAPVDVADDTGSTALMVAVTLQDEGAVAVLLMAGADTNLRDFSSGATALMKAMIQCNENIAAALLKSGADPEAVDNGGESVMDYAREDGNAAMMKLIKDAIAPLERQRQVSAASAMRSTEEIPLPPPLRPKPRGRRAS